MHARDGLPPLDAASLQRGIDLLDSRVHGLQPVQPLLERLAQPLVRLDGIRKHGVATGGRHIKCVQEGGARRLLLVRDVRVPRDGARALREERLAD